MDVDFGGSDITVIVDVLNWEECGEQSFKNIIIMIIIMIHHITCSTGRSAVSKEISFKTEDSNTSKKSSPLSHTLSQTIVFEKHETN